MELKAETFDKILENSHKNSVFNNEILNYELSSHLSQEKDQLRKTWFVSSKELGILIKNFLRRKR